MAEPSIPTSRTDSKWWILFAVGVGTFMSALDSSVVNTILPVIGRAFGEDVAGIQWVVTVYLLVVSGLLLTVGRLGDLRGHKTIYRLGFVVFVLGSVLCGLAPTSSALIACRGLQALGAAMLFANSPAILTRNFPATQRGQALGILSTMTYLGLTLGPSLGGWLASRFGWRTVFYINVPVGLAALALCHRFVPRDAPSEHPEPFDRLGALTFMTGLVVLLLALNRGHASGWGSPLIVGLLLGAVALLGGFVAIERRAASPMLDLSLFRSRVLSASLASAVLNYLCLYGVIFLLPFYLIRGRGFSPAHTGLVLTAQPIVMAVVAPISGTLSDRLGSRLLCTAGMAVMAVGLTIFGGLGSGTPIVHAVIALAVVGFGTGMFISPNSSALLGAAPRHRQGIASAILATGRNTGMVLGVGVAGAAFTTVQARMLAGSPGAAPEAAFLGGIHAGFLVLAGIAVLAVVTSAVRGE